MIYLLATIQLGHATGSCHATGLSLLQRQKDEVVRRLTLNADDFVPVDGGSGRACRGANSTDNLASYYEVFSTDSLEECKDICRNSGCKGIEFREARQEFHDTRARCEVWTTAINATFSAGSPYVCLHYMSPSFGDALECRQVLHVQRDGRWTPDSGETFCKNGTPPSSVKARPASWFQEHCVLSCSKSAVAAVQPLCPSCCRTSNSAEASDSCELIGPGCCCPAGVSQEIDCVDGSVVCPHHPGGGGMINESYQPAGQIRRVTDVIPGFATEKYAGLPGIPYVNSDDDAAGNDIRAHKMGVDERMKIGLTVAMGAMTPVRLGWAIMPASMWFQTDTVLESPEQFETFRKSHVAGHITDTLPQVVDNARRFRDTEYATSVWFHEVIGRSVVAFNAPLAFAKVKSTDIDDIAEELNHRVTVDTTMYWLDLRDMDITPAQTETGRRTKYAVGAVVLLRFERMAEGKKVLLPTAIRLGTRTGGALRKAVFVRGESTESAWRFALLGAACSFSEVAVAILHIYAYHVQGANFQWNFYNNLSPQHRLHNALKDWTKYTAEFNTQVLTNKMPLMAFPYHNIKMDQRYFLPVFAGWERLARQFPYYKLLPSVYLAEQGIEKQDFSHATDWDLFPIAKFQLDCEQAAARFVGKLVDYYYTTDLEVQSDIQLQQFVTAMQDPQRGNVQVTPTGEVSTPSELKHFLTVYLYGTINHGGARMRQYTFQGTLVPNFITSFMDPELILTGDASHYSVSQMLRAMPDTRILGQTSQFAAIFEDVQPLESAFPSGNIDRSALPYDCGVLNSMWLEVLAALKEIFAEGYYFKSSASEISQWPRNQEA